MHSEDLQWAFFQGAFQEIQGVFVIKKDGLNPCTGAHITTKSVCPFGELAFKVPSQNHKLVLL